MRNWLPLCFAAAVIAAPVQAQYIYMDMNGDQQCTSMDIAPYGDATIDVWLDTSKNGSGEPIACETGEELTFSSYEIVLAVTDIAVTGWTNSRPEFTQSLGFQTEGPYVYMGYTSGASVHLPQGLYKLGTMTTYSAGGCTVVQIRSWAVLSGTTHTTRFYTRCQGFDGDYTMNLGQDFFDTCVLGGICDDAESTTWGKIKKQYLPK